MISSSKKKGGGGLTRRSPSVAVTVYTVDPRADPTLTPVKYGVLVKTGGKLLRRMFTITVAVAVLSGLD